jgi:hypothetical protein
VYVTVGEKFPTVDIRHFWIPIDSDKPVPSKRGIALNQYKRNGLQNSIPDCQQEITQRKS